MARFKKSKAPKIATVIGAGTKIHGDIEFSDGLHIDGVIKGNVMAEQGTDSALTLSENGTIEGEVRVCNIVINGRVTGDVYGSQRVELAPDARVNGTVYYNLLEMAMGAEINGQLIHTVDQGTRRLGYDGTADSTAAAEAGDAAEETGASATADTSAATNKNTTTKR
jgi:cytoskeletal protein CcmA (bactofilin family)